MHGHSLAATGKLATVCAVLFAALLPAPAHAASGVLVADFDYTDTSGELSDQTAAHAKRLKILADTIREELSNHSIPAQPLACGKPICSLREGGGALLRTIAKTADAEYLVYGDVQKMSTLIGWIKIEMIDVTTGEIVASQVLSLRGDNDEAFERAARFAWRNVLEPALKRP
ncbi:DUF2380 domain-containing protein [Terrihabitans sp. B22-R8]|uniref:DUF2380 domain-containing protein n=1 Tax=Terrihabitans sp. B22-R8 TaxID=3425128 RepID=UPI00403D3AFA